MKVIKATQQMLETRTLVLGFQGENLRTQLRIDCAATFAEYPNATPALAIKPPSGATYPVFVERDGNEVVWDIVANNLALKGDGELQLTFYKDSVIAKTSVGHITVNRSLQIDGEMPDVVATWIENANRKLAEVDAQIVELEGMVDTATDAATRAEQSASTASTKAEQAAGSAATATEKATEATNAAGTATAKAAEAQTAAQTATEKANAAAESERIATAKAGDATTAAGTATTKAEQATEAAQTATEKARDASASATAAQTSATDAAASATAASASETAAKASETAASTSATQAAQSVQDAGANAQTAMQKAAEASQSATNAATSEQTATQKATEAEASAQAASDAKTAVEQTAEQLADSLEQIEQNKQDIAELDERKANIDGYYPDMTVGNAEQLNSSKYVENSEPYTLRTSGGSSDIGNREYLDAVVGGTVAWNQMVRDEASENSTDFADVVTVDDAVEDAAGVKVKIEPVQDLHGYDHPWPAGGGKNLFDPNVLLGQPTKYDVNSDWSVTVKSNDTIAWSAIQETFLKAGTYRVSYVAGSGTLRMKTSEDGYSTEYTINANSSMSFTLTDDGNVKIKAGVNATSYPINCKLQIELGSTSTDWTPYSNICPITGWDGVQVWDDPKHGGLIEWNQLCNEDKFIVTGGASYTLTDHRLIIQGSVQTINVLFIPRGSGWYVVAGHKYLVTGIHKKDGVSAFFYNGANVQTVVINSDGSAIVESAYSGDTQFYLNRGSSGNVDIDAVPQFFDLTQMFGAGNEPSTVEEFKALFPADYYPYDAGEITTVSAVNGNPYRHYSITFPTEAGTVYGGELTVNEDGSGSLVVDRKSIAYDGSDNYAWSYLPNYHCMVCGNGISDIEYGVKISDYQNSYGIVVHRTAITLKQLQFGSSSSPIEGVASSVEEWKSQLNANPIQVVYPLAAPVAYTLSASQIRTLLGTNNVWADTGDLALTYTGTDEHLTLESGKKYLSRISGTDSMLLGSGQEITAAKGTDNVFDLTQMFGTAVADYVYGQGAAFFRKWFGKQWYPYNAGELLSVEGLQSHDMVGFNAWDEEMELGYYDINTGEKKATSSQARSKNPIPVLPNTRYFATSSKGLWGLFYDGDGKLIEGWSATATTAGNASLIYGSQSIDGFLTPPNAASLSFYAVTEYGTTYKHDICINLSHNGSRNGEYEPYEKHSYPLDSSVVLRGIPKVGANGVYWDGDRYLPDGTVERRYGVVDLGTLNWSRQEGDSGQFHRFYSTGIANVVSKPGIAVMINLACEKYIASVNPVYSRTENKTMCVLSSTGGLYIVDTDYANAAAFKSAMQGVLLLYELATPTTETAQPYHSTQWVSDWGTEEFVSTGIVPVGTETRYPANLRDKLQHLPDAASGNGSYLITQTDGQMVLTPFPAPPSTAGNYVLKATVVNGVATYTWEVAT